MMSMAASNTGMAEKQASIPVDESIARIFDEEKIISAFSMDDERIEEEEEILVDEPPSENIFENCILPKFDSSRLGAVLELQKDKHIEKMIKYLKTEIEWPNKNSALGEAKEIKAFLNHASSYKLSEQNVLFRLW